MKEKASKKKSRITKRTNPNLIKDMLHKKISRRDFIKYSVYAGLSIGAFALLKDLMFKKKSEPKMSEQNLKEGMKEAKFYEARGDTVYCQLCPNQCILNNNMTGVCRVRKNINGTLYTLVYGQVCAAHNDPIEKKPLFHFLPGTRAFSIATVGCNMRCLNCQNWSISQASPGDVETQHMLPGEVVQQAQLSNSKIIAYTYTEPTIFYEFMYDTAKKAHEEGLKNIVVSNGYVNEKPLRELSKVIDAANIDLKGFDKDVLMKLTGGNLTDIKRSLKIYKEEGVWLEITNLIVPSYTDDLKKIEEMCEWVKKNLGEGVPIHFSRFHPQYKLTNLPPTPVKTLERAQEIALKKGLKYVYIGNVPGNEFEDTYCPNCKKRIIERKGYLVEEPKIKDGKCQFCGEEIEGVWSF
jgi:pyruvate formate lyase activating enzyme